MKGTSAPRFMPASYLRGLRPSRDRRTIPVENGTEADPRRCLSGGAPPRGSDGAGPAACLRDPLAQPSALPAHLRGARRDDRRHAGGHLDGAAAARGVDASQDEPSDTHLGRSPHAHPVHRAGGGQAHAARLRSVRGYPAFARADPARHRAAARVRGARPCRARDAPAARRACRPAAPALQPADAEDRAARGDLRATDAGAQRPGDAGRPGRAPSHHRADPGPPLPPPDRHELRRMAAARAPAACARLDRRRPPNPRRRARPRLRQPLGVQRHVPARARRAAFALSRDAMKITGIVLAGGKGSRMGGVDKGLQPLRGKPMVEWVLARFAPQVGEIIINANQNLPTYEKYGHRVVSDAIGGFAGPLAGLHAGLNAARHPLVVTVPCDSPFLPNDLVGRLQASLKNHDLAVAKTGAQPHPVFALMKREVRESLEGFLASGGRKIDAWYAALKVVEVSFDDEADALRNVNTLDELKRE